MDQEQRNKIRELFFYRVTDSELRSKIIQLAGIMNETESDPKDVKPLSTDPSQAFAQMSGDENDGFWEALYHYALPENWDDALDDYEDFVKAL